MEKLSLKEIAKAVGSECKSDKSVTDICTDTRKIVENSLFIALEGENFDGHDYIEKAFSLGAVAAISHKKYLFEHGVVIKVENTNKALLDLAKYYKSLFNLKTVAVTGSVGKTSTKEMIYSVLNRKFKTLKTQGNFNNEIGLPLTLFGLDKTFEAAVIEMGMSNFGEISRLSRVALPDIGVITNIGVSHIENLGDREGILNAKLEIREGLSGNYPLVINIDNDMLSSVNDNVFTYGIECENANVKGANIKQHDMTTEFDIIYLGVCYKASVPAIGIHNVYNALAAFCVGVLLDMDINDIIVGLSEYETSGMRQNIVDYNGITVIEDCYNASPDSMKASLNVLSDIKSDGRKIAVLGDMLELGKFSEQMHFDIGVYAADKADIIYCYGNLSKNIVEGVKSRNKNTVYHFEDKDELSEVLSKDNKKGDVVLIKASRGMKLEDVIKKTYKECK